MKLDALVLSWGSYMRDPRTSTNASVHIAHFLAEELDAPVLWSGGLPPRRAGGRWDEVIELRKRYEWVFMVGNHAFANPQPQDPPGEMGHVTREKFKELFATARYPVYVQNDYNLRVMPRAKAALAAAGRDWITWTTVPRALRGKADRIINWNSVAYEPSKRRGRRKPTIPGLFYYGAFRPGRVEVFKKYFEGDVPYAVTISSPVRSLDKFGAILRDPTRLVKAKKVPLRPLLESATASLLIEDIFSYRNFTSPPTRFYEMLSAGTPILVDSRVASLRPEEFDLGGGARDGGCMVDGPADVVHGLLRAAEIGERQRRAWGRRDYKAELREELWKSIKDTKR